MIYVFLANGFEEMEALAPVDCLRRCALEVATVGIGSNVIRGSHGIMVAADLTEEQVELNDALQMIVLPGGMPGTLNLEASQTVQSAIRFCMDQQKYIAAICAAPSILGHLGLLRGKRATCYQGFEAQLTDAVFSDQGVVVDGNLITAKGAGAALPFALELVSVLESRARADLLADALMYP